MKTVHSPVTVLSREAPAVVAAQTLSFSTATPYTTSLTRPLLSWCQWSKRPPESRARPPPKRPSHTSPVFWSTSIAVTTLNGRPSFSCQVFTTLPVGLSMSARPSSVPTHTRGPSTLTAKMWSFGRPSATVNCFQFV